MILINFRLTGIGIRKGFLFGDDRYPIKTIKILFVELLFTRVVYLYLAQDLMIEGMNEIDIFKKYSPQLRKWKRKIESKERRRYEAISKDDTAEIIAQQGEITKLEFKLLELERTIKNMMSCQGILDDSSKKMSTECLAMSKEKPEVEHD